MRTPLLPLILLVSLLGSVAAGTATASPATWSPPFTVGGGASSWWIEIYTSNDVTGMDVIGRDGEFYMSLPKHSWGAWAASPPSEMGSGQAIQLIARRSDGSTAGSSRFRWMQDSPPGTQPGWNASIARGPTCSTSWVEMVVSAEATAVWVKAGAQPWTALTHVVLGRWTKATDIAAGTKVVVAAARADGAMAYSPIFTWMQ